ncbi:hypothetical protein AAG906_003101 [Vitis piasezkii]
MALLAIQISFNWWLCGHGASDSYLGNGEASWRWWRLFGGGGDGVRLDSAQDDSVRSIGSETLAFFFGGPLLVFWPWRCQRIRLEMRAACSGGGGRWEARRRGFRMVAFCSERNFGIIFVAHFVAAKRVYGTAKWHLCAKGWFRSCETPFEMASRLRSGGFQGMEISQPFRSCETGVLGCEMALRESI